MINNITSVDTRPQMSVAKAMPSVSSMTMPPILGFKTPILNKKALLRVKKVKRGDNLIIPGIIDEDYIEIVEEEVERPMYASGDTNFFTSPPKIIRAKHKVQYLKNCYLIDYIQSPKPRGGLGTQAIKELAEKAFFDKKANGRIVTFSAPIVKENSPAIFFYKLGFRFTDPECNEYIEKCIRDNMPDIPPQIGMMYLPTNRIQKLLRYGDLF